MSEQLFPMDDEEVTIKGIKLTVRTPTAKEVIPLLTPVEGQDRVDSQQIIGELMKTCVIGPDGKPLGDLASADRMPPGPYLKLSRVLMRLTDLGNAD